MLGHIVARQEHYQSGETAASDIKKVRRFKNVISYIEQNYRKNITLEELRTSVE